MKVFYQSILLQLILSLYLAWRFGQAFSKYHRSRAIIYAIFASEVAIYLFGFIFYKQLSDAQFVPILKFCTSWYIGLIYTTLLMIPIELFRFLDKKFLLIKYSNQSKKRLILRRWIYSLVIIGMFIILFDGHRRVTHPIVTQQDIYINKTCLGRDSLKVVFATDLHMGEIIDQRYVRKYVDLINAQKGDIILIGGDMIDYETRFADKNGSGEILKELKAPLGMYMVLGNHEYRASLNEKISWLQSTGGTILIDSIIAPNNDFYLIGRDDYTNRNRKTLQTLTSSLDHSKPIIVLDHQPISLNEDVQSGIDLSLFGHTHAGQIWPFMYLQRIIFEYSYGYRKKGDTQFFISSGLGFAGAPFRVGTRSEIVVLNIKFKKHDR